VDRQWVRLTEIDVSLPGPEVLVLEEDLEGKYHDCFLARLICWLACWLICLLACLFAR